MKAVRCKNGHWYDSETYSQCPHCDQSSPASKKCLQEGKESNKRGFSLFRKGRKPARAAAKEAMDNPAVTAKEENKDSETSDGVTERFFADIDDDKTESMFEANDRTGHSSATKESEGDGSERSSSQQRSTSEPLAATVQRISAMDEGKTLSYFDTLTSQEESTSASLSAPKTAEPVVGWLVVISGVHWGESFQLYVGKNTIGRNHDNRVALELDQSVSRENHATIIYEPKKREFYLQSGNSDGLVYLNDSFMTGTEIMKEKDVLEIGASKMIFIPLCGAAFSWEQYM